MKSQGKGWIPIVCIQQAAYSKHEFWNWRVHYLDTLKSFYYIYLELKFILKWHTKHGWYKKSSTFDTPESPI